MHEYSIESGRWEPPLADDARIQLCHEFKGDLSTAIWNSTALFCRDPSKATERLHFACDLAAKVHILNNVEAHGQEGSEHTLRGRLKKSHLVKYS